MPLVTLTVRDSTPSAYRRQLLDAVHGALVAVGVPPPDRFQRVIDTVFPNFRDMAAFEAECTEAERDGFTGKMAIHPDQVPVINATFTPSVEAVQHSLAIVAAFEAAGNAGVVGIDGKMVDRPHLRLAERLLARARAAGV